MQGVQGCGGCNGVVLETELRNFCAARWFSDCVLDFVGEDVASVCCLLAQVAPVAPGVFSRYVCQWNSMVVSRGLLQSLGCCSGCTGMLQANKPKKTSKLSLLCFQGTGVSMLSLWWCSTRFGQLRWYTLDKCVSIHAWLKWICAKMGEGKAHNLDHNKFIPLIKKTTMHSESTTKLLVKKPWKLGIAIELGLSITNEMCHRVLADAKGSWRLTPWHWGFRWIRGQKHSRIKTNKTFCTKQKVQQNSGVIGITCKTGETDLVDLEPLAIVEHQWHVMHGVNLGLTFRDITWITDCSDQGSSLYKSNYPWCHKKMKSKAAGPIFPGDGEMEETPQLCTKCLLPHCQILHVEHWWYPIWKCGQKTVESQICRGHYWFQVFFLDMSKCVTTCHSKSNMLVWDASCQFCSGIDSI